MVKRIEILGVCQNRDGENEKNLPPLLLSRSCATLSRNLFGESHIKFLPSLNFK